MPRSGGWARVLALEKLQQATRSLAGLASADHQSGEDGGSASRPLVGADDDPQHYAIADS